MCPNSIDWLSVMENDYPMAVREMRRVMPRNLASVYDGEDFVADALTAVSRDPSIYRGASTLTMIARRRMIDVIRVSRGRISTFDEGQEELVPDARAKPVHDQLVANEMLDQLHSKCKAPHYREMVNLRVCRYTTDQIAAKAGISARTVDRFFVDLARATAC